MNADEREAEKAAMRAERDEFAAAQRAQSEAFTELLRVEYNAEIRRKEIAAWQASEEAARHADEIAAAIEADA